MEKLVKKNLIYKGKILELYNDDVECDNGYFAKRELVNHHGGAAVLVCKDQKFLLIRQFRYAYNADLYEIPAGKLELHEDPYQAAMRELEEEAGLKANKLDSLGSIYPTCGYSNEIIYLYLAKEFITTKTNFDRDENIDSFWFTKEEILSMIKTGQIKDAKTITAFYTYILGNF